MKRNYLIYIFLVLIISSCEVKEQDNAMENSTPILPEETWNVALLMVDGVYNSELIAPMDILHHTVFHANPGMKVFTVAPDSAIITTFEGLKIIPDFDFQDSLPHINVLVVPSAENSMGKDLENEKLISWVKNIGNTADYVMSLCDGAFVLAKAGLLDGKESTTFPSDIVKMREMFPQLTIHEGVSFVHDGKMITSSGGAKSYDPALYLSELLYGKKAAQGIGQGLVIDWDVKNVKHLIVK